MKALITGATGFVGRHLADKLPEAVVAGRSIGKLQAVFKEREARVLDGSKNAGSDLFEGVDTVYHLAGESIFGGRWNAEKKEAD